MKILIETCLDDLLIVLIKNNKTLDFIHEKKLQKKSDSISHLFKKLLFKNNVDIHNIDSFYVTNGPGSFMGIRAGLLFASTICGLQNKKLFICSSLKFIKGQENKDVFWDARGNKSYAIIDDRYKIVDQKPNTKVAYENIIKNIDIYLKLFVSANPFDDNTLYLKEPKIS